MLKKIERAQQLLKKEAAVFRNLSSTNACRRGWSDLSTEASI